MSEQYIKMRQSNKYSNIDYSTINQYVIQFIHRGYFQQIIKIWYFIFII